MIALVVTLIVSVSGCYWLFAALFLMVAHSGGTEPGYVVIALLLCDMTANAAIVAILVTTSIEWGIHINDIVR
jgi:hypothetical protein